jgi:hypothetical protein
MGEPIHISEILPAVMAAIDRQMERRAADEVTERNRRVVEATADFQDHENEPHTQSVRIHQVTLVES